MKKYDYSNHAPWYSKKDSISVVVFGNGVTSIGEFAFYGCSNLNNITIPDSITKIGNCAFYGCRGLSTAGPLGSGSNIEFCWANRIPDYAFGNCRTLNKVIIPEGITAIGAYAFCFCVGLSSITIPDGVTNVGDYAFQGCTNLTSVTVPKSVTRIARAFYDCSSLVTAGPIGSNSNIVYGWTDEIPDDAFLDCNHLSSIIIPNGVTSIGSAAFSSCYELTSITIPSSVTSIGCRAFSLCSHLNSITIPSGVTIFSDYLFSGCTGLTDITISNTVTSIGKSSFAGCTDLTNIIIPIGVNNIGEYAFAGCTNLASIIIADNVHSIGCGAFSGCTGLTAITIPNSVSSVGSRAFEGCASLTNITISNSLSNISNLVFGDCTSLKSVTIPNSVTIIESGAFYGCSSLTTVSIPSSITSVGPGAFEGCIGLTSAGPLGSGSCIEFGWMSSIPDNAFCGCSSLCNVTMPSGLNSIGSSAFRDCSSLSSIVFPDSLTSIGDCAFSGCGSLNDVAIPEGVTSIGREAFSDCSSLTSITIPAGVHDINGWGLFSNCTGLTSAGPLGSGSCIEFGWISNIPDYAFSGCESLTNCIIPSSVINIGQDAFCGCRNLTSITIPDGVTSISVCAFMGCSSLNSIRIPDGVTSIGNGAFSDCSGLTYVAIPGRVTSIGRLAFSDCTSLIGLEIPVSMNTIGDVAFDDCNNLTDVYYAGSEAQWEQIEKGRYNDCLINANIHYNSVMPIEGITFNDLSVTAGGNSICWSGSVFAGNDTILTATVSITTPTLPDGSFDTGYFRVTNVNAASFDYASIHSGAVAVGGIVECTDESGNAKTLSLELPGDYTVTFHVYTAGSIYKTEQRIVTIGSNGTKPVLSGFSHTASVTMGGPVYLSGTITAAQDGTLQRVTVKCNNAGGIENTVATVAVDAASLDLSTLSFSTAEFPEFFTGPGTYEFVLYAAADNYTVTDNSIAAFTVTVTEAYITPTVVILPVTINSSSSATLQAQVTDDGGGIITDFGFNLYWTEDSTERYDQYAASSNDPYYKNGVTYDSATGIITCRLEDYSPDSTAFAEAFATYYRGELPITGFSAERAGFTTDTGDIGLSDPKSYSVFSNGQVAVSGTIDDQETGVSVSELTIHIYNHQHILEEDFPCAVVNGAFSTTLDLTDWYAGSYTLQATASAEGSGKLLRSEEVPFTIPGKLRIDLETPDETDIGAAAARVSAVIGDTQGKRIEYYGFRILDADGNLIRTLQNSYDPKDKTSITYDESSHVISGVIDALPGTSFFYEAFATYKEKGVQIESFSGREQLTMKRLDIEFSRINNSKTDNYMLDRESVILYGSIGNIADGTSYGTPIFIIADQNGLEVERKYADLSGNNVSCELDLSEYPVGKEYSIHSEIEDDQGRVSYSVEKIITIPKPASSITFKTNLGGEPLPASEEHLLALYNWMVVDIDIDTSRSYIESIRWTSSDPKNLVIHPWNESESSFDKARPQTCQFDGIAIGDYTVTVTVTNHDGSTVSSSLMIQVRPVTILQFLDFADAMKPVSGATVTFDDETYTTNDQGCVILTEITSNAPHYVNVSFVVDAFHPFYNFDSGFHTIQSGKINTFFLYDQDIDIFSVRLSAGYSEGGKRILTHDQINVLSSQVTFDLKQRERNITVDLEAITNPGRTYTNYELIQDGKVLASSKTGVITGVSLSKFKQNAKYYIQLTDTNSKKTRNPLQIRVINSDTFDGTASDLKLTLGDEFKVKIPDQFFPIGGHEIKLDLIDIPFSFMVEGSKISVAFGLPNVLDENKYSVEENKNKLKDFQGLFQSIKNTGAFGFDSWLKLDRKIIEKGFEGTKGIEFFGLKPKLQIVGTGEIDLSSKTFSYSIYVCAKVSGGRDFQFPPPLPFIVTNFSYEGGIGGKLTNTFDFTDFDYTDIPELVFKLIGLHFDDVVITPQAKISIGFGAGMAHVFNVTINGGWGVEGNINLTTGYATVDMPLSVFIRAKLLTFEHRWDLRGTTLRLKDGYFSGYPEAATASLMSADDLFLAPTSEYDLADRSYLSDTSGWYPSEDLQLLSDDDTFRTSSETLMTSVYADTQLHMVQTESDRVMVWLTDDSVRNAVNRTKLVYSVFEENTGLWSAPQSVLDDGTLDSYPVLATDGNEIYLTWTDMNRQFAETDELESCVLASEVAAAWFNPQTKSFQKLQRLTDNAIAELDPSLTVNQGRAAVCWISNDAGDPWGNEGNNTLWVSVCEAGAWSEPTAVKTMDQMVTYAQAGWLNNKLYVVCCVDSDGSFNTNDDTFVLAIDPSNGNETVLASDGLNSQVQFVRINGEDLVIWHSDQRILSVTDVDSQPGILVEDVANEYQMISDINGTVLLQVKPFESYSELYASVFDPNSNLWGNPIQMTYLENGYINDFSAVIEENGELATVYTAEMDGRADIRFSRLEYVKDISLDYVDIDDSMLVPGQLAELAVEVSNHGFEQVDSLMLRMFKDGVLLSETLAEVEIACGESKLFSVPIAIPEDEGVAEYEIVAELLDGNEINYSNNVQVLQFGYGDLSLESTELYCDEAQLFTFLVQNLSGYPDQACIQVFQLDSGDLLDTIDLGIIGRKSQTTATYLVEDLETPLRFCLVSSREESYTNDNITYYVPRESSELAVPELDSVSAGQPVDDSFEVSGQAMGSTEGVSIICASYNASGKQLDMAIPEILDDGTFACTLSAEDAAYIKIFLVTEDWKPLDMQRIDLS